MIDAMKLENQFCFVVYALSREITKIYRPFLNEIGLTYTQYLVMLVLWEKDGIPLKELGFCLNLDSGTLTPLLKKLEKTGHVLRKRDLKDERNLIIHLTDQGRDLLKEAQLVPGEVRCKLPLKDDEIAILREQIKDVLKVLQERELSE